MRATEFAPALRAPNEYAPTSPASLASSAPASGYAPPTTATSWKAGRFTGADFPLQPDGTLRCPAGNVLVPQEHRRERDGSLRIVYSASIRDCRPCSLRDQCQWNGRTTAKPRQVSILLHPLSVGSAPLRLRETGTDGTSGTPACVCIASTWRSRWSQLSRGPLLLPLRRFLGPSGRITAYHGTSGWLAMLELKRRSGSRSPCSGSQTAWRPFSAWPLPNASSASREPSPASEKQASPSGFFCLFCLIAPHIHAPYSLFPFHPSTSLRADLLPIPVELTGNPESRLEHFGELIAHVVGHRRICPSASLLSHSAGPVRARSQGWFVRPYTG